MSKKSKTIRLSDKALEILQKLAKKDDRSEGYIVEHLFIEKGEKEKLVTVTK